MIRPEGQDGDETGTGGISDVIVVGAGMGGIYAVHRLVQAGFSVTGVEGASGVGGVWFHNRYPGARVDLEGLYYCYHDPELYREWQWSERYPAQPELLAYLNHAADKWGVKQHFRFETWVAEARWDAIEHCYVVTTDRGSVLRGRFLVMATGPLSAARTPDIPDLEDFDGEVVRTAHWPDRPVELGGRRIGIVGTSASGVQAVPHLALAAAHLHVFQRTPHYSVPAQNGPIDEQRYASHLGRAEELWQELVRHPGGTDLPIAVGPVRDFDEMARAKLLEERWAYGGHGMGSIFTDQGVDLRANEVVAEFVRDKIRAIVTTPDVAERLVPDAYPIGTHRLCVDVGYYETFNRDNVTLVDLLADPIERVTPKGVQTRTRHVDLDVLVLATGFNSITGALYGANLRDEEGRHLRDHWARGPATYLGLTTHGFPNLFLLTGPGSPSVLANMFAGNEHHVDLVVDLLGHLRRKGFTTVEPTVEAQEAWMEVVAEAARPLLRNQVRNYMLHVNEDDGSKVFMPYPGGFDRYVTMCDEVVRDGYRGLAFS